MTKPIDFTERLKAKNIQDRLAEIEARSIELLREYGYYVHVVLPSDQDNYPEYWASVHTHGLEWTADHPNLEIQIRIDPQVSQSIIAGVVSRIFEGERFESGRRSGVIQDFDVFLLPVKNHAGETLTRIILPDADGNLDPNTMAPPYEVQFWREESGK